MSSSEETPDKRESLTREELESLHSIPLPKASSSSLKYCKSSSCSVGVELEHAAAFFDKDVSYADGFKPHCKQCRAKGRQLAKVKKHRENRAKVDDLIAQMIEKAQFGGSDVPHIAELYAKVVALMGGANGFAMAFLDTYLKSEPGSAIRQRLLNQLGNLGTAVTATGAAEIPNELLSDEELQKKIERLARQAKVIDALPPPIEPEADDDDLIDDTDSTEGLGDE
jgi:hypothetical protein